MAGSSEHIKVKGKPGRKPKPPHPDLLVPYLTPAKLKLLPSNEKAVFVLTPGRRHNEPRLKDIWAATRTPEYRSTIERRKKKLHKFYRLPEDQREAAQEYFDMLCRRHSDRIAKTPRFAKVLHMITLNQFKNPRQSNQAANIKHYKRRAKGTILHGSIEKAQAGARRKREAKLLPRSAYLPT